MPPPPAELLARFDVTDPRFLQDPYPVLRDLREATPIFWFEPSQQWFVTRYADVHAALRDRLLGRSYLHRYTHAELGRAEPDPRWADFMTHERWSLLSLEPPDHTRIRSLIARAFTPGSIAALRPTMERFAAEGLDRCLAAGDSFDLIADYAQRYSVAVICALLGLPDTDTQALLDWSHAIVKMYELTTPDAQKEAANTAAREFMAYTAELIGAKRARPDGLLVSRLAQVEDSGKRLTDEEIICTVIVLLNAGHEATVNTMGNGTRALMQRRDQWACLTSGEVPASVAVEEMIRFDPPLQLFERWVLDEGVEIAGQPVGVGDEIATLFGSANRDPRRFVDADTFDIGRGDMTHVGFGGGIHFCVGAPLARLEIEVALATLVARCPNLTLTAEPRFHDAFVIHGLQELRVTTGN